MKKLLIALSALTFAQISLAQLTNTVIYKYNDGKGKASYSLVPPHGEMNFERYQISTAGYLNPVNPEEYPSFLIPSSSEPVVRPEPISSKDNQPKEAPVEGTISREQRCKDAQNDIALINERQTIYEEDQSGNLVPLSQEQAQERLKQAQEVAAKVCE